MQSERNPYERGAGTATGTVTNLRASMGTVDEGEGPRRMPLASSTLATHSPKPQHLVCRGTTSGGALPPWGTTPAAVAAATFLPPLFPPSVRLGSLALLARQRGESLMKPKSCAVKCAKEISDGT